MTIVERLRDWASPHYAMQLPEIPLAQKDMRDAADRIEALEAEVAALTQHGPKVQRGERLDGSTWEGTMLQAWQDALQAAETEARIADELRAEVAALRKDAERYRWLRDRGDSMWAPLASLVKGGALQIDAAIDAAIQQHAAGRGEG